MESVQLDIWSILLGFGALNGYFLAIVLWSHSKGRVYSNHLLSLLLICISLFVTELTIARSDYYFQFPYLILSTFPAAYLIGPLFYFYSRSLVFSKFKFTTSHVIHLIPVVLALFALIPFYLLPPKDKIEYINQFYSPGKLTFRHLWLGGLFLVQTLTYLFLILKMLTKYQHSFKEFASGTGIDHIQWLNRLIIIFSVAILLNGIVSFLMALRLFLSFPGVEITLLTFSGFIHIVGYNAIRHPDQLFPSEEFLPKYSHSTLSVEHRKKQLTKLSEFMEEKKPFLNPELTIQILANEVGITVEHLSQTINAELSTNFYDFVNSYRVEDAKINLLDPANKSYSILGIALNSGFNSKTSFNRIFKKNIGMTPSQYISRHKK